MKKKETGLDGTRANMRVFSTLDVKEMLGMYIYRPVIKKHTEDLIDEDTGDVISIERCELLYLSGQKVTLELLQKINFDIIEGSITEPIQLCNQRREGMLANYTRDVPYSAKVKVDGKTRKVLLKASGIRHAIDTINDYFEMNASGAFHIMGIDRMDDFTFLEDAVEHLTGTDADKAYMEGKITFEAYCSVLNDPCTDEHPDEDTRTFWQLVYDIEWYTETQQGEQAGARFVVKAVSAEVAMKAVLRHLTAQDHEERDARTRKIDGEKVFTISVNEVKRLPVSVIIPEKFTIANRPEKLTTNKSENEAQN